MRLAQSLNLLRDSLGVHSVDYTVDLKNIINKLNKLEILYDRGSMDSDLIRYIPGLSNIYWQGQKVQDDIRTKKAYAASTYTNKNVLELNINLTKNYYTNFANMVLCMPIKIRNEADTANIDVDLMS